MEAAVQLLRLQKTHSKLLLQMHSLKKSRSFEWLRRGARSQEKLLPYNFLGMLRKNLQRNLFLINRGIDSGVMFAYQRTIRLSETDATGVLYFSELLKLAEEVFEVFLLGKKFTINDLIENTPFLMPIVHAEADYAAPLKAGDVVDIELNLDEVGESSFTLHVRLLKERMEVGVTKITHVVTSKETEKAVPIPKVVLSFLEELCLSQSCRES